MVSEVYTLAPISTTLGMKFTENLLSSSWSLDLLKSTFEALQYAFDLVSMTHHNYFNASILPHDWVLNVSISLHIPCDTYLVIYNEGGFINMVSISSDTTKMHSFKTLDVSILP